MTINNDLERNGENTETSSLFKPKILCAIDRIKEKKKRPDIDSIYDYLSMTEASNIDKVSIELILNELVKENVLVKDFSRRLAPSNKHVKKFSKFFNSLHSDSCSNNELTIKEPVNSEESTADNNTPPTYADIQAHLITNYNLSSLTKHSDKAFMNIEAKFSALKGYI